MHTFLRILAILFLAAAVLWGCTPLGSSFRPLRQQTAALTTQTPTQVSEISLTEILDYSPAIPDNARSGVCAVRSQYTGRTDVWQCTVDDTTYDPCFTVGAEETIVCTEDFLNASTFFRVDLIAPLPLSPSAKGLAALDLEELKSLWYFGIDAVGEAVVLNNGEYRHSSAQLSNNLAINNPATTSDIVVRLSELKTQGDLDLDGDMDAASVLIATSSDIFTRYYLAAILNENGKAVNAATISLGDGIRVDNLAIENGEIVIDMTVHGLQDPLCCPTIPGTRYYKLNQNQLEIYTGAWQVELDDGILCSMPAKHNNSFGYRCTDGRTLVGALQPGTVWTGQRPRIDSPTTPTTIDVETVAIRRLWQ